jgi:hypothetical protein
MENLFKAQSNIHDNSTRISIHGAIKKYVTTIMMAFEKAFFVFRKQSDFIRRDNKCEIVTIANNFFTLMTMTREGENLPVICIQWAMIMNVMGNYNLFA